MSVHVDSAFTSDNAYATLRETCAMLGLDPAGAELIRFGQNAIYQLWGQPYVVRIARTVETADVSTEVRVARWLADVKFPATRLADIDHAEQPIAVGGRLVTVWDYVSQAPQRPTIADLGRILRCLHQLTPPPSLRLPSFEPLRNVPGRLARAPSSVDPADLAFLRRRAEELAAAFADLSFELPLGPIHGDSHPGNLMRSEAGTVVIGDLECFAIGPREWDLALPAIYRYGFGWLSDDQYRAFVDIYGYDVAQAPSLAVLRAIRELNMTSWLMQNVDENEEVRAEFQQRIDDLRSRPYAPRRWRPF
jgi:aminoglycoside phosphotransferase (APT) family kinase protein